MSDDIIDHLAGIALGSTLDALRRRRPATRDNAELAFRLLFEPEDPAGVTRAERLSLGLFVAALHQDDGLTRLFADRLADAQTSDAVTALAHRAAATGPFGSYPPGPLSVEDTTGAVFTADADIRAVFGERLAAGFEHVHLLVFRPRDADIRAVFGERLAAGFEHVHLLVFRPRDASADALKRLTAAGWSADDAVTLSQIVAFLAFQIRVVAGLKLLAA